MTEHPIVTQLSLACLPGYRAAMEELAEQRRLDAQALRAFALDRAAIAAGLIAREESREVPAPDRYWLDGHHPDEGSEDLREAWAGHPDAGVLELVAMRSSTWPGLRWVVMAPGDDGELMVFTTQDEAETCRDTWPREEEEAEDEGDAAEATDAPVISVAKVLEQIRATPGASPNTPIGGTDARERPALQPEPPAPAPALDASAPARPNVAEMRRLYEAGTLTPAEIAERFGITTQGVQYHIRTKGWTRGTPPPRPTLPEDEAAAREDVLVRGRGAKWVAEEYGWDLTVAQAFCARVRAEGVSA